MKQISIIWLSCMLILGIYGLSASFVYGNTKEEQEDVNVVVSADVQEHKIEKDHQLYLPQESDVTFHLTFPHKAMQSLQVKINDELYIEKNYPLPTKEETIAFSSAICDEKVKQIVFQWQDEEEQLHSYNYQILVDQEAPTIASFTCQKENIEQSHDAKTWYGLDEKEFIIQASDGQYGSGVKTIIWYTVNKKGEKSECKEENVDEKGQATITIQAPFEGYVYASAIDACNNQTLETNFKSAPIYLQTSEAIEHASKVRVKIPDAIKFDNLYIFPHKEEQLPLLIEMPMDGIKNVSYRIFDDEQHCLRHKKLKVKQGLKKMKSNIRLNQVDNNQRIQIHAESNCGYVIEKELCVCLDTKAPLLAYEKKNQNLYMNEEQVIHLCVQENHFDCKQQQLQCYANDQPQDITWHYDDKKQEYVADMVCMQEGVYTIDGYVEDMVHHKSNRIQDSFIIDYQTPTISFDEASHSFICMDQNLDPKQTTIHITRNNQNIEETMVMKQDGNKQWIQCKDFNNWLDGYYNVEIKAGDYAQQHTCKHYAFVKNAKGSTLSSTHKDQVYQQCDGVQIEEKNLSPVHHRTIFLAHKGTLKKLDSNDYQVFVKHEKPYVYSYQLKDDLFVDDGTYQLYLHSIDDDKNQTNWYQRFAFDRSSPKIAVVKEQRNHQKVYVQDNDEIASLSIQVDGKKVPYKQLDEGYAFEAKHPKSIHIEVKDHAGNVTKKEWKKTNEDLKQAIIPMLSIIIGILVMIVIVLKHKMHK